MTKPFKKLLGNRVYLFMPKIPESLLVLSDEVKKTLISTEQDKYRKLTVYAVGDTVTILNEGDVVLVDPSALATAPVIKLTDKLDVLLVSIFQITHVW